MSGSHDDTGYQTSSRNSSFNDEPDKVKDSHIIANTISTLLLQIFPLWISGRLKLQHKKTVEVGAASLEAMVVNISFGAEAYNNNRDNFKILINKASKQCVQALHLTELLKHTNMSANPPCNSKF